MGREVRRVPKNWQHPKRDSGEYISLHEGPFEKDAAEWYTGKLKWIEGLCEDFGEQGIFKPKKPEWCGTWEDWTGECPVQDDYMPTWSEEEKTHLMMYESTSEGSPISPAFETPEELARWLTDNGASAFGGQTASYEGWLRVAQGGYAPSAVMTPGVGIESGVEAAKDLTSS